MRPISSRRLILSVSLFLTMTSGLRAQSADGLGTRALGMGGAFVAVADDATAVYWNPAGLGTGDFFSLVLAHARSTAGDPDGARQRRSNTSEALIGTPPLGLGYYRLRVSTAAREPGARPGERLASHLVTHNAAVAVAQSVGDLLNLGATVRVVHGRAVHAGFFRGSADDLLDQIGSFETVGTTTVDFDAGAMLRLESMRVGLVVRNLRAPTFEAPGGPEVRLDREVRVGAAVFPASGVTVSADADLTRTTLHGDQWRTLAAGVEGRIAPKMALRAGVRASTAGDARPAASIGGSYAVTALLHADAFVMRGGAEAPRGWGVGLRASF